jgi:hypothetical protein
MALGLEHQDMERFYGEKYAEYIKKFPKINRASLESEYELKGFNSVQAQTLADLTLKVMANRVAILEVIRQNNMKIDLQLEQK